MPRRPLAGRFPLRAGCCAICQAPIQRLPHHHYYQYDYASMKMISISPDSACVGGCRHCWLATLRHAAHCAIACHAFADGTSAQGQLWLGDAA